MFDISPQLDCAGRVLKLDEPDMSNKVAIAWNGAPQPQLVSAALSRLPWGALLDPPGCL